MKRLADLTWTEAAAERARDPIVLVPIGSTEAHGPHLPLATDAILSDELARRAALALEANGAAVLIAPTLSYAITDYACEFAGTISLKPETATALVADVCAALIGQGFARVCLVNSHLEPAHVASLREACARAEQRTGRRVAFPDQTDRRWARTLTDEYKRGACHAGSYETSLVLAARPELVRDQVRAGLAPLPIDLAKAMKAGVRTFVEAGAAQAYFGDPAAATVEEGDAIYALLVTMIVETVRETWPPGNG
ncbi:MAG TPA: creatininase family protein [Polyangia bacterium]|nr:creatininase family protein [Polyangia bacterium]